MSPEYLFKHAPRRRPQYGHSYTSSLDYELEQSSDKQWPKLKFKELGRVNSQKKLTITSNKSNGGGETSQIRTIAPLKVTEHKSNQKRVTKRILQKE